MVTNFLTNSKYFTYSQFKNLSLITWGTFFGYILLLIFFDVADIYHRHFFVTGLSIAVYNVVRILFIAYLMWLFYVVGFYALNLIEKSYYRLISFESALLAFFSGVGIWHIFLLLVGFAGFYNRSLMAGITSALFLISLPRLDAYFRHAFAQRSNIYWPGWLLLLLPVFIFLITKGTYPAGGHDYYNHYFYFYRKVTESGSILPNEVWYHFYYSKGAALFFLSMLLTDPLAPQLATTAMIFAGAMIIFSILNRSASWRLLPWIGVTLYITFLIYTPGPLENLREGGWGDLEKPHEPAAILMLAILWATIFLAKTTQYKIWGITLTLTVIALVLINPMMAFISSAYLLMVCVFFIFYRKKLSALWVIYSIAAAAITFICLAIINFLLTGLPEDQNLLLYWPIVNFNKIKEWGILFELLYFDWAKTAISLHQPPITLVYILKIMAYLRLDVWGLLLLLSVAIFGIGLCRSSWRIPMLKKLDTTSLCFCGGFLLLVILFSLFIGRAQPISFYRFTTFSYAPMLCFCLLLLSVVLRDRRMGFTFIFILAASIVLGKKIQVKFPNSHLPVAMQNVIMLVGGEYKADAINTVIKNGLRFTRGKYSIAEAYQNQQGWPGRMAWGGIYPAAEIIWRQLPPHTRIWSMHVHSYCMLPNCNMEGYMSFRLSPHADLIFFGEPLKAKKWLQKENLNYFFFSRSLQITDPLPLTPLFSPKNIMKYFGIAWTDGDNTLLTWKERASIPIDTKWLQDYTRQAIKVEGFPFEPMRAALNSQHNFQGADLPWNKTKSQE